MSRRNGSATSERRSPKLHPPRFHEPRLVPCPLAPDQTSPSARTLKAIQESWGNSTMFEWFQDKMMFWWSRGKNAVCYSQMGFHPLCWAEMCSSQWRDLLFVSCVVAERSPVSRQQTQHPALVDRNFRTFSLFLCARNLSLFLSSWLILTRDTSWLVGWLLGSFQLTLGIFYMATNVLLGSVTNL